jgi:hypothetical protein
MYNVWVCGKNDGGTGAASPMASGKPLAAPGAPVITGSEGQLSITWPAAAGADEYDVYYGAVAMPETLWATVSATGVTMTGLTNGTTYHVRVKAKNSTGISVFSPVANGTPVPSAGLYKTAPISANKIGTQNLASSLSYISSNANNGDQYYIVLGSDESAASINLSYSGLTVGITLMSGTNRTIQLVSSGPLFYPRYGVTLTLEGGITLRGTMNNNNSLVYLGNSARFVMHGGVISGNKNTNTSYAYGGGVYIESGSTFTMSGGKITGNTVSAVAPSLGARSYGGGVYVNGTFTMSGGEISGNTASATAEFVSLAYPYGGGVFVGSGGTFTQLGGEISGNSETKSYISGY